MKLSKSEQTRGRILEVASAMFVKEGFSASRTSEIAKSADVSEATLFKYYKSKQGLLEAVVGIFVEKMTQQVVIDPLEEIFEANKDGPPEILFKKLFMNRLELMGQIKNYALTTLQESRFNMDIKKIISKEIIPQVMAIGERIVDHYKERGIIRQDVDSWILLRTMMMGAVGMIFMSEFFEVELRGGSVEAELDMVLEITLRGAITEEWRAKQGDEFNE